MKKLWIWILAGFVMGIVFMAGSSVVMKRTSTDTYCASCHDIHPRASASWKQSLHFITASGTQTHCVDCHLPPHGQGYIPAKVRTGMRESEELIKEILFLVQAQEGYRRLL